LAFSDRIFPIVIHPNDFFQVMSRDISNDVIGFLFGYQIVNAYIIVLLDKDVMKLVLEDVYK